VDTEDLRREAGTTVAVRTGPSERRQQPLALLVIGRYHTGGNRAPGELVSARGCARVFIASNLEPLPSMLALSEESRPQAGLFRDWLTTAHQICRILVALTERWAARTRPLWPLWLFLPSRQRISDFPCFSTRSGLVMNVINFSREKRLIWASGVTNSTAREDKAKRCLPRGVLPATARCLILDKPLRPGRMQIKTNACISRRRITLVDGTFAPNCCEFVATGI